MDLPQVAEYCFVVSADFTTLLNPRGTLLVFVIVFYGTLIVLLYRLVECHYTIFKYILERLPVGDATGVGVVFFIEKCKGVYFRKIS